MSPYTDHSLDPRIVLICIVDKELSVNVDLNIRAHAFDLKRICRSASVQSVHLSDLLVAVILLSENKLRGSKTNEISLRPVSRACHLLRRRSRRAYLDRITRVRRANEKSAVYVFAGSDLNLDRIIAPIFVSIDSSADPRVAFELDPSAIERPRSIGYRRFPNQR